MSADAMRGGPRSRGVRRASDPESEDVRCRERGPRDLRRPRAAHRFHGSPWAATGILALVALLFAAPVAAAAPTIAITSPSSGSTLTGTTLVIAGTATNATKVTVCIDGTNCQDASGVASWSATFDISGLSEGSHTVRACAISGPAEQCATLVLTISFAYRTVQTLLEGYVTPALTVVAVAMAIAVALRPRSYRAGSSVAASLAGLVIVDLALRGLTSPAPVGYYLSAAFLAAALVVDRVWRPRPREAVA